MSWNVSSVLWWEMGEQSWYFSPCVDNSSLMHADISHASVLPSYASNFPLFSLSLIPFLYLRCKRRCCNFSCIDEDECDSVLSTPQVKTSSHFSNI